MPTTGCLFVLPNELWFSITYVLSNLESNGQSRIASAKERRMTYAHDACPDDLVHYPRPQYRTALYNAENTKSCWRC